MRGRCGVFLVGLMLLATPASPQRATQFSVEGNGKRLLTVDDLLKAQDIGEDDIVVSSDGQLTAFVIKRSAISNLRGGVNGNDHSDIWIVPSGSDQARNITDGASDGSGSWAPVWSPDGSRMAFLSTRGGNLRPWIWERSSGALKPLTTRSLDYDLRETAIQWVSDREVVCVILPDGEKPDSIVGLTQTPEKALEGWSKASKGVETTASVLESGLPVRLDLRPRRELVLIGIDRGTRILAVGSKFSEVEVSRNHKYVKFLETAGVVQPTIGMHLADDLLKTYSLGIVDLAGHQIIPTRAQPKLVIPRSFRWSPDGTAIAFLEGPSGPKHSISEQMGECNLETGRCSIKSVGSLGVSLALNHNLQQPPFLWSTTNTLLIKGAAQDLPLASGDRQDWWSVHDGSGTRNLTSSMREPPTDLFAEKTGSSFVGLSDDHLWRIWPDGRAPEDLLGHSDLKMQAVLWPEPGSADATGVSELIVAAKSGGSSDLYEVHLGRNEFHRLPKPAPDARLKAFSPQSGIAVFMTDADSSATLWIANSKSTTVKPVFETNTYLKAVQMGAVKAIEYRSLNDGKVLKGWVLLPAQYQKGRRYPLITWVYAGTLLDAEPPSEFLLTRPDWLSLQLLASHGYAVLFPSMPLQPEGKPSDPLIDLTSGVLPAIDKVIDLEIADPDRLGLMGHSYGGYSTYGLVTETNRFKAAVALAGASDLVSDYGQFDARTRYSDHPQEALLGPYFAEESQIRMGNPPWLDMGRYLRNSPIFYVERVQTPVMIIQGDLDYVSMQQGEEFFTALYRQNKRAEFVRYWGEGHGIESPANLRDMWKRIYSWFDDFLKPSEGDAKLQTLTDN